MENRIKECQLDLFADRTSTATMQANQLRLWFASIAYVLLCALRRIGLAHTQFAEATCGTIRLKLLKIGALVRVSTGGSRWRWRPPAHGRTRSNSPTPGCATLSPDTNQTVHRCHTARQRRQGRGEGGLCPKRGTASYKCRTAPIFGLVPECMPRCYSSV